MTLKRKHVLLTILIIITTLTKKKKTIPFIPKIGPKIKKEMQKFGFWAAFQTGPDLENVYHHL